MLTQQDVPAYYLTALLAMDFLQAGYVKPAELLATRVMLLDDKYILPYQVAAYVSFLTHDVDAAQEYFQKLRALQPEQEQQYLFGE